MRKTYKVSGTSTVKPVNLPEGMTVEETEVRIQEKIKANIGRTLILSEAPGNRPVHIRLQGLSSNLVDATFTREEALKILDTLNEILGSSALRKVTDDSGIFATWYEIEPDRFVNEATKQEAEEAFQQGGFWWTLESIRDQWGIKSIVNQ